MTTGDSFAPIETERLVLRALVPGDAAALLTYRADPAVTRFQTWEPASLYEVRAFIDGLHGRVPGRPPGWYQIGIALRGTGELIGDCGVRVPEDDPLQVEVGITLAPASQGRGLATEALLALLGHLFEGLGVHRVYASVDPDNAASLALLARVGMRREAHFVGSYWFKDRWADDIVFGMLESEWRERA